jgi:hypothetical protein
MENQEYKSATTFKKPEVYIACPFCGEGEHRVDHLFPDAKKAKEGFYPAGPWSCGNSKCLQAFNLRVFADESVQVAEHVRKDDDVWAPIYVLMRRGDLFILLDVRYHINREAFFAGEPISEEDLDHIRYYYEESTCPTNWMQGKVHLLSLDGDTDPHHAFDFVAAKTHREVWKDIDGREPSVRGSENEDVLVAAFPELGLSKRDGRVKALLDINVPLDIANLVIDSGRQGFVIKSSTGVNSGSGVADGVKAEYFHMDGLPATPAGQAAFDAYLRRYWGKCVFAVDGKLQFTGPYVVVGDRAVGGILLRTKVETGELLSVDLIAEIGVAPAKHEDPEQIRSKIVGTENESDWSFETHFGITIQRKFDYPKLEVGEAPLPSYFMEA